MKLVFIRVFRNSEVEITIREFDSPPSHVPVGRLRFAVRRSQLVFCFPQLQVIAFLAAVLIQGYDNDDVKPYLEKQVRNAVKGHAVRIPRP